MSSSFWSVEGAGAAACSLAIAFVVAAAPVPLAAQTMAELDDKAKQERTGLHLGSRAAGLSPAHARIAAITAVRSASCREECRYWSA
jgi:hypothetical protein